jgi:hypothetical protein
MFGLIHAFHGLDVHDVEIGRCPVDDVCRWWTAMRGFRMVACATTTMLLSEGLVAAMTVVVGSCSGVFEGPLRPLL